MFKFTKSRTREHGAPFGVLMPDPIAPSHPAFLVVPARIRRQEDAAWPKASVQLLEHARQRLAGDMKERRVREYAIKALGGQCEPQKILVPDFAAAVGPGHLDEPL